MKARRKVTIIEHFQIILIAAAGIFCLVGVVDSEGGLSAVVRVAYLLYGMAFLVGAVAYYAKPRFGALVLLVSLLSLVLAGPLLEFPQWTSNSPAERSGMVVGTLIAALVVSPRLLEEQK